MSPIYSGLLVLLVFSLAEVSSRPSNNESLKSQEESSKVVKAIVEKEDGSIFYQTNTDINSEEDNTKDIVERIKNINNGLHFVSRKPINLNEPTREKTNGLDKETLQKIQQIIASANLIKSNSHKHNSKDLSSIDEHYGENSYSRALKYTPNMFMPSPISLVPYPYMMNMPMIPVPVNEMFGNDLITNDVKSAIPSDTFKTRQRQPLFPGFPSFPSFSFGNFQLGQWPSLFPILIKNPVVALNQGGGWENFIEYGQSADVCSRKQKSSDEENSHKDILEAIQNSLRDLNNEDIHATSAISLVNSKSREARAVKKRTVDNEAPQQEVEESSKTGKKLYTAKPTATRKSTKRPVIEETNEDVKHADTEGDLRFPFGDFSWFVNKKTPIPSPGFLINKLKVRKGGVAIAGPGGIATAGRGGTAIVGPGGLAYTKPGGLAIAGPHARVVALSPYADLNSLVHRLPHQGDYYLQRSFENLPIREGKLVATGPVIYYHPTKETSTKEPLPTPE
ncbi:unnamed protein product, partial [Brenthis ino]